MTLFTTPLMKGDENHGMVYVYELIINDLKETVLRLDLKQPLFFCLTVKHFLQSL